MGSGVESPEHQCMWCGSDGIPLWRAGCAGAAQENLAAIVVGEFSFDASEDVKSGFRSRFVDESFASEASATFLIVDDVISDC